MALANHIFYHVCFHYQQLSRCVLLCEIVAVKIPGLPEKWENAISTIKSDVERGQKILDFFAEKLSPNDKSIMLRSDKLSNHFLGLAECVRLARYIKASLSEMLCLEVKSVQGPTFSEYSKSKFMASFESIDNAWSVILLKALDLGILDEAPQLASVDDIRVRCANIEHSDLCQFTLQPLSDQNQGTSSTVTWNGKQYMACAANFLANRLSNQATF